MKIAKVRSIISGKMFGVITRRSGIERTRAVPVAPGPLPRTAGYKWSVVKAVRVVRDRGRREREGTDRFDERRGSETLRAPHYGRQKSAGRAATAACLHSPMRRRNCFGSRRKIDYTESPSVFDAYSTRNYVASTNVSVLRCQL